MAGVPTGRGCDTCRKQKKKCDQAKPACARCTRLKIPCTGSGVRRFMFKSENPQAVRKGSKALVATNPNSVPAAGPSSGKTLLASNLVHIIELRDPACDISTYGWFIQDLPRRIGSNEPLDAAIAAFVAGFGTLQDKTMSTVDALDRYVFALKALRKSMQNSVQANSVDNICSIYLIAICQESSFDSSDRPFMQTILTVVVIESFTNPNVELGPWFWQAFSILGEATRPLRSGDGKYFASLDMGTLGEISYFIRNPDKYLYQIQCTYALIQTERPRLIQTVKEAIAASKQSGSMSLQRRLAIRFHTANAVMLTIACVLNHILRSYHSNAVLIEEAKSYVDEIIILAKESNSNRPIAAASAAFPLIVALASMEDYKHDEVETLLLEYQTDFLGLHYFDDVQMVRRGFENIDRNNQTRDQSLLPNSENFMASFNAIDIASDKKAGCIIL
ncbi:unnamed protein product [Fusarium graminearum]|nr:unnamed protein product [Fusarium graminearum]